MRSNPEYDLNAATWHKSSHSGGQGGDCLEVADGHPTLVRDSKNPHGPKLAFRPEAWTAFVAATRLLPE